MEDIKDEEKSDSSFTLSDFDYESDKEESFQEEEYHIESFGNNWEEINEGILDKNIIWWNNYIFTKHISSRKST